MCQLTSIAGDSMMDVDSDGSYASDAPKKKGSAAKSKAKAPTKGKKAALVRDCPHSIMRHLHLCLAV